MGRIERGYFVLIRIRVRVEIYFDSPVFRRVPKGRCLRGEWPCFIEGSQNYSQQKGMKLEAFEDKLEHLISFVWNS